MRNLELKLRIDSETGKVSFDLKQVEKGIDDVGKAGQKAGDQVSKGMDTASDGARGFGKSIESARSALIALASFAFAEKLADGFIDSADEAKTLAARIDIVTDSQIELNEAQQETFRISQDARTALSTTVGLYERMERASNDLAISQESVLTVTEAVTKSLKLSSADAQGTASVITQLGQALENSVLRGEEFNAVADNGSRIMQALRDELGKTQGELRKMAFAGELTSEIVIQALINQSDAISKEFEKLPVKVEGAYERLSNANTKYLGSLDESVGFTEKYAESISFLADNLDEVYRAIGTVLEIAAVFAGAKGIGLLISGIASLNIGVTAATVKVTALGNAIKAAFLANPIGASLVVGYGLYELIDALIDAEKEASEFSQAIDRVNEKLAKPIPIDNQEKAAQAYAEMRKELVALNQEIDKRAQFDQVLNNQSYIDGEFAVADALRKQKQALQGRINLSETLNTWLGKLKTATDEYAESLRENELKALNNLEEAKQREIELAKELIDWKKEEQEYLSDYGSDAEKIAIIEAERNAKLDQYNRLGTQTPGVIDAINRKYDELIRKVKKANEPLDDQVDIWEKYYSLLREVNLIDDTAFAITQMELTLEELEKSGLFTTEQLNQLREAIHGVQLQSNEAAETTDNLSRSIRGITAGGGLNEKASFEGLIRQGLTLKDIWKSISQSMKEGASGILNGTNVLLQGGQFVFDTFRSHSGKDGTGQILSAINDLAPLFGPVGSAISGIANTINSIFGGGLFGTSFETTGSTANLAIGENGVGGQLAIRRKRKRSLFRGNEYQTLFEDLDAQVINGLETLRESALQSVAKIASQLGIEVPELISAGFFKEFDKDGNLIREYSEIAGREFNESFKEFSSRFLAENLIAALNGALPLLERTVTTYVPDYDSLEFGSPAYIPVQSTEEVGEAEFLADRFRDQGAQALLDFAQFATVAVTQMQDNAALMGTLTENLDITQELQRPGQTLLETYTELSAATSIYEGALGTMGISLDATREEFIRMSAALAEAAGGSQKLASLYQNYFENYFTPEELRQRSLESSSELLGQQATNLGIDPTITQEQFRELFQAQIAAGNLTEEQQVLWLQFAATLANVNDLIEQNTAAEQERLETLQQAQQNYANFNESIANQLAAIGNSETINSIAEIRAQHEQNIATLNDLAIAAGEAGASELELMRVHQLAQAQIDQTVGRLRQAIATLQNQLYSDDLERRIAELEEIEGVNRRGFASVQNSSNSLFDNWRRAIDNLRDYSQSLIFSQHSPLEAGDQLDQALADFYAAVAAAQGGNLEAAQSLPGLADLVLGLNDQVNASGSDFNVIFDGVQDALNSIDIPNGISNNIIQGNFSVTPSAELQGLYDQLEARNAAASADNRLQLATQLAQHLRELALAVNQPLFNIAGEIGLNMTNLVTDLGVNLDNLTAESVQNLASISNLLGVELSELATNLGDGVSDALGELADAQSLLNDALEGSIEGLPTEYRDLLAPLLRDVENAADGTAQEVALQALEDATNGLPIEYRNLLAPYFDNIDQTTEMSLQSGYMQEQIDWMHRIHDLVAEGIQPPPQEPSPPPNPASAGITSLDNIVYPDFNQNINTVSNQQNQNTETAELKKLVKEQTKVIEELKTIIKFQHIDKMNANKKIIANTEDTAQNTKQSSFPHTNRKIGK